MTFRAFIILSFIFICADSPAQIKHSPAKKKKVVLVQKKLDLATLKPLLYFKIENMSKVKGRAVALYGESGLLHYAFIDSTGKIEFSYPKETDEETPGFTADISEKEQSLSFANKSASYRVFELANKIGVEATIGGILYEQIGIPSSKKGSIKDVLNAKLENVIIR